ncbi:MAG TPA: GntR family transcriptional regulator [Vicinamibacteria bacterium]|nr:GntR family transcriptional regulator [Vicinamibacteria bacterium]
MDFVLSRKGGVPVHDQLLAQLELKILGGLIIPGQRLPSVRVLARRLGLHANTVSSAYRELEESGHVELRRGAGVYVRAGTPARLEDARGLDEMIRLALSAAFRRGYSGSEIRTAVERWLRAAPPERVVIVDPQPETIELVAHEIRTALGVPASGCTLEELGREPGLASGALLVALPYHWSKVARLAPGAPFEPIHVDPSPQDQKAVLALPAGATVVIVSTSPSVLKFAGALVGGLRGDELLVETRLLSRRAEWRRLLPAADLVLADALAAPALREAGSRRLRELRLLAESDLAHIRKALVTLVPAA